MAKGGIFKHGRTCCTTQSYWHSDHGELCVGRVRTAVFDDGFGLEEAIFRISDGVCLGGMTPFALTLEFTTPAATHIFHHTYFELSTHFLLLLFVSGTFYEF